MISTCLNLTITEYRVINYYRPDWDLGKVQTHVDDKTFVYVIREIELEVFNLLIVDINTCLPVDPLVYICVGSNLYFIFIIDHKLKKNVKYTRNMKLFLINKFASCQNKKYDNLIWHFYIYRLAIKLTPELLSYIDCIYYTLQLTSQCFFSQCLLKRNYYYRKTPKVAHLLPLVITIIIRTGTTCICFQGVCICVFG